MNITLTKDRNDLIKYYSFDYKTMGKPKDFANIQAIQSLRSSVSELVDAIEQNYVSLNQGKRYLKAIIKLHNKLVYEIGGDSLLNLDDIEIGEAK